MSARTLVLLRHAKAENPGDVPDHERKLTETGRSDADAAGAWLADEGLRPQLVLCSTATRTRLTWHGVSLALAQSKESAIAPEVHYEAGLYDGGRTEVVDLLRAVPDDVRTVLVIGHNPTMSDVSALLHPHDPRQAVGFELKTSGLAVHRTEDPWSQTEPGSMRLIATHTARG
jgi:phosphohistidine phosphatase